MRYAGGGGRSPCSPAGTFVHGARRAGGAETQWPGLVACGVISPCTRRRIRCAHHGLYEALKGRGDPGRVGRGILDALTFRNEFTPLRGTRLPGR
ncbi:MAG: hypothetical protein ACLRWQ_21560 [Flavonifractor plautii]